MAQTPFPGAGSSQSSDQIGFHTAFGPGSPLPPPDAQPGVGPLPGISPPLDLGPPPGLGQSSGSDQANGKGPLEDRLRSMILNHSPTTASFTDAPDGQPQHQSHPQTQTRYHTTAGKSGKRRPNQAQRRQMSTQLSIAFDPRPPLPQTARPYVSPTNSVSHPFQAHNNHHQPCHKSNLPHSATFRPPGYLNKPDQNQYAPSPGVWRHRSHQQQPPDGQQGSSGLPFDAPSHRATRTSNPAPYIQRGGHSYTQSDGQFMRPLPSPAELEREATLLSELAGKVLGNAEIETADIAEKEAFRQRIELICQDTIARHEREVHHASDFPPESVQLQCFGSLSSGFATKASDMDLGLLSPFSHSQPDAPDSAIPRLLEKALLDAGLGARLITRTRVPIIKLCERPSEKLMHDLMEERGKWERGIITDHGDGAEDDLHDDQDLHNDRDEVSHHDAHEAEECNYAQRLGSLKQQNRQSLSTYYCLAKRVLRRVDGRDMRNSNIGDFTDRDFNVLTDVCRAYVRGLADPILRSRLEKYSSLSFPEPSTPRLARSLLGVNCQIEGELLVMAWEDRVLWEKDTQAEDDCRRVIEAWKDLQQIPGYGLDTLAYNKELQVALDRIRKIPSLQLRMLEQGPHETATDYYQRASKLLADLGVDHAGNPRDILKFVGYYVAGIKNEQIRAAVSIYAQKLQTRSLAAVAYRHKTLHLALDYEKALEKGFYSEGQAQIIRRYINILRHPMETGVSYPIIPLTPEIIGTVHAVRTFPDPSRMACNQPRDQYRDKLEFPVEGIGVQCDINFSAHLALQNTLLLRCYSHTDSRVRPLVLFVKHWAKMRNINEAYRGTLNSYGYVLMVLHYLVNVADPFVCPNLQELGQAPNPNMSPAEMEQVSYCKGRDVRFWRNEEEIKRLASQNLLNQNRDSIGALLRGFFEYFAERGPMRDGKHRGFDWGRDVLSLRTHGGLLSKQQKGWTGAKTVIQMLPSESSIPPTPLVDTLRDGTPEPPRDATKPWPAARTTDFKEVRHRYLFAIEDPFELDHNVARTVTHNGIVAIRDEFRRAWRLIQGGGRGNALDELLQNVKDGVAETEQTKFAGLLREIHGDLTLMD